MPVLIAAALAISINITGHHYLLGGEKVELIAEDVGLSCLLPRGFCWKANGESSWKLQKCFWKHPVKEAEEK